MFRNNYEFDRVAATLEIDNATLVQNDQGVLLKSGWLFSQQISTSDAIKIRDWLNATYPLEPAPAIAPKS